MCLFLEEAAGVKSVLAKKSLFLAKQPFVKFCLITN